LDKEREFQKGYKHNVEIWRKNRAKVEQKIKRLINKVQDENEELKGSITPLKSQDEELQDLRHKSKIWQTIERKWIEALFLHKQQEEALGSQVKTLTTFMSKTPPSPLSQIKTWCGRPGYNVKGKIK
jgi:Txe/YoeB family toxin of Txe-Axe toxin-antitoxin module